MQSLALGIFENLVSSNRTDLRFVVSKLFINLRNEHPESRTITKDR